MDTTKIAELLHPFVPDAPLPESLLENISTYIDLLLRWNARVNLTAIRDPGTIVTRHFGESLFTARHLFQAEREAATEGGNPGQSVGSQNVSLGGSKGIAIRGSVGSKKSEDRAAGEEVSRSTGALAEERGRAALQGRVSGIETEGALAPVPQAAERRQNASQGAIRGDDTTLYPAAEQRKKITLADIGSGAGFPGVPIKLWAPHARVTLIESNNKKATFLRELARALTLTDIDIKSARAESLSVASFDIVTLRAVEHFEAILPIASGLVAPSGRLALLIGAAQVQLAQSLLHSYEFPKPFSIPLSDGRCLLIGKTARSGK